ncbi:hypothetical protein [Dactylosporangium sp. CA-233914]|uniref:hypothetical protein n=1 Tax=Dactylosporangium sp. CA-233914 TaxID=3239934 RepID=UPI003D923688
MNAIAWAERDGTVTLSVAGELRQAVATSPGWVLLVDVSAVRFVDSAEAGPALEISRCSRRGRRVRDEPAGRIADGYLLVKGIREAGVEGGFKAGRAETEIEAVATAHRRWLSSGLPGELSREPPSPKHFEQASQQLPRICRATFALGAGGPGRPGTP